MDICERISQMSHAIRLKVGSILVKDNNIISFGWNGTPTDWDNNCEDIVWAAPEDYNLTQTEFLKKYPYVARPSGVGHEISYGLKTKPEVLHSEANCLSKIGKSPLSSVGATMYCTHAPCLECAKLIHQFGINSVYYRSQYRSQDGIEFLKKSGVNVEQY